MSTHTALTVPTRFVEGAGIRFAYRRWGKVSDTPLVFMSHFTGNLDDWDPLVTDGFAADQEVILFNNAGVASSGGETPSTVAEMMRHAVSFLNALDLKRINVLGFSLGGMIAQQMALEHPGLLNRILLVGTGPQGGEGMEFAELSGEERTDPAQFVLTGFFTPKEVSQCAGRAYLQRMAVRSHDRDQAVSSKSAEAQLRAIRQWGIVPTSNRYATLKSIHHPILIVHGNKDIVVEPINALILAQQLSNAQLIVYTEASHGAQYQHADLFLQHAKMFLNAETH